MPKILTRGDTLYLEYYVDKIRYRRSTNLTNKPENINYIKNMLIPQLEKKISDGSIYKKKDKSFRYYGDIYLRIKEDVLKGFLQKLPSFQKVINYFGERDIDDITRLDIKRFYNSLDMKPVSKGIYRTCLKEILELAVDDGIITYNPSLNISLGKEERPEIKFFKKEEVEKLISTATGYFKTYLLIAFNTGMRPEEILGLQFTDIKNNILSISRVRTRGRVDYPKTKNSYRKLKISTYLSNEIEKLKSDSLYLFGDKSDVSRLRYQWRKLLKDSNVDYKAIKNTRHTYATHMLKDNIVSINELSGLLGHSSPKVTLTHYASVIDSIEVDFDNDFNLFGSVGTVVGTTKNKVL